MWPLRPRTSPDSAAQDSAAQDSVARAWETARMRGTFSQSQKRRLRDIRQEFHLEALDGHSWNLYPVYSSKHTLAKQIQPGQPVEATWELDNPHGTQTLQFILQVSGSASVSDVTLEIDSSGATLVPATLPPGSILKYSGTEQSIVYDKSWNEVERVVLDASELKIGTRRHKVRFGCRFHTADEPEVKLEFRTVGEAKPLAMEPNAR